MEAARTVFSARTAVAEFLGVASERLIFTPGCTHSINYVLKSFPLKSGDAVVVSALEHNAVMRPLHQLERERGIKNHRVAVSTRSHRLESRIAGDVSELEGKAVA